MDFAALLFLAVLVEGLVEYLFANGKLEAYLHYIALALGIVLAVAYKVDILSDLFGLTTTIPFVGSVVSGVIIGRGSNYVNDIISKLVRKGA